MNSYQIEGEKGFIYIEGGSNGLSALRIVTKDSDETINLQPDPDRWFYEIQSLTQLLQAEDREALYARLDTMVHTIEVVEGARLRAGIRFPGD